MPGKKRGVVRYHYLLNVNMTPAMDAAFDAYRKERMVGVGEGIRRLMALALRTPADALGTPPLAWNVGKGFIGFLSKGVRMPPDMRMSVGRGAHVDAAMLRDLDAMAKDMGAKRQATARWLVALGLVLEGYHGHA